MTALPPDTALRSLPYAQAMALAMAADPSVILMGEDIGAYGGAFQVTLDLIDRFGPDRAMDTPISELGGAGVAALTGRKPTCEFQFSDFAMLAMEPQVDTIAAAALFDIETDKAAMEVESPADGRQHAITARPGDKVVVGTVVALICAEGEAAPAAPSPAPAPAADSPATPLSASATPRTAGLALAAIPGTGPLGRIQADDATALARLHLPTSLIRGRQDRILPWSQAIAAEGAFALHLLSGAGHVPHLECPDRLARILSRHLAAAGATV